MVLFGYSVWKDGAPVSASASALGSRGKTKNDLKREAKHFYATEAGGAYAPSQLTALHLGRGQRLTQKMP